MERKCSSFAQESARCRSNQNHLPNRATASSDNCILNDNHKVLNVDGEVMNSLSDGQSFGEVALYGNGHLMRRTATVVSPSYCDLDILLKANFDSLKEDFPDAKVTCSLLKLPLRHFFTSIIALGALRQTGGRHS